MRGRRRFGLCQETAQRAHHRVQRLLDFRGSGWIREPKADAVSPEQRYDPPDAVDPGRRVAHPALLGSIPGDVLLDEAIARPVDRGRLLLHRYDLAPSRDATGDE